MEQKTVTTVQITNTTLEELIRRILREDLPGKEDYIRIIGETFQNSDPACKHLVKVHLGEKLPKAPETGAVGYVHVDKLGWVTDKEGYKNSEYCRHGYIPCVVVQYQGLNSYSPLQLSIPDLNNKDEHQTIYCQIEDFIEEI